MAWGGLCRRRWLLAGLALLCFLLPLGAGRAAEFLLSQGVDFHGATLAVTGLSRAVAFLRARDYVVPEDVQAIWVDAVAHRLLLVPGAERSVDVQEIARAALQSVDAPRIR